MFYHSLSSTSHVHLVSFLCPVNSHNLHYLDIFNTNRQLARAGARGRCRKPSGSCCSSNWHCFDNRPRISTGNIHCGNFYNLKEMGVWKWEYGQQNKKETKRTKTCCPCIGEVFVAKPWPFKSPRLRLQIRLLGLQSRPKCLGHPFLTLYTTIPCALPIHIKNICPPPPAPRSMLTVTQNTTQNTISNWTVTQNTTRNTISNWNQHWKGAGGAQRDMAGIVDQRD